MITIAGHICHSRKAAMHLSLQAVMGAVDRLVVHATLSEQCQQGSDACFMILLKGIPPPPKRLSTRTVLRDWRGLLMVVLVAMLLVAVTDG